MHACPDRIVLVLPISKSPSPSLFNLLPARSCSFVSPPRVLHLTRDGASCKLLIKSPPSSLASFRYSSKRGGRPAGLKLTNHACMTPHTSTTELHGVRCKATRALLLAFFFAFVITRKKLKNHTCILCLPTYEHAYACFIIQPQHAGSFTGFFFKKNMQVLLYRLCHIYLHRLILQLYSTSTSYMAYQPPTNGNTMIPPSMTPMEQRGNLKTFDPLRGGAQHSACRTCAVDAALSTWIYMEHIDHQPADRDVPGPDIYTVALALALQTDGNQVQKLRAPPSTIHA